MRVAKRGPTIPPCSISVGSGAYRLRWQCGHQPATARCSVTVTGTTAISNCCTTRGATVAACRPCPQDGQSSKQCVCGSPVRRSAGTSGRCCRGCLGCPPALRCAWPSGGGGLGGLTRSEEGGLEEVVEFLRDWAACSSSWATVAIRALTVSSSAVTCACKRSHPGQRVWLLASMRGNYRKQLSDRLYPREPLQTPPLPPGRDADTNRLFPPQCDAPDI